MSDVATISKLLSNDTLSGFEEDRPISRKIGASISNSIIASMYFRSSFETEGLETFTPFFCWMI